MSPTSVPTLSRSRVQAVELRRVIVSLITLALALATLVAPREASAATASRVRLSPATTASYARAMLGLLNQERRAHGRRPLTMAWRLRESAHRHNLRMARANVMSHQLPGEAFFATRISNTGYRWRAAGENIGWTSSLTSPGLMALEKQMYHEVPPNDGHRVNILSRTFKQVGIDVYYDARHQKLWFTQDFGTPA
jgi:uncharacterized protein YkwD